MCLKLAHKTGPCEGLERECEKREPPKFVQTLKKTFLTTYYKGNSKKIHCGTKLDYHTILWWTILHYGLFWLKDLVEISGIVNLMTSPPP